MGNQRATRQSFTRQDRIRRRREYAGIMRHGRRQRTANLILISVDSRRAEPRLGITVSRKVGKSRQRNRIKRLLREYFRLHRERFGAQDVVVVVRAGHQVRRLADLETDFAAFFQSRKRTPSSPPSR